MFFARYSFLKYSVLIFLFVAGYTFCLYAQQTKVDSLLVIAQENKGDVSSFRAFKELGGLSEKNDARQATRYYHHAIEFPFRTVYAKEFVQVCNSLGELYHNTGQYDSSLLLYRQGMSLAQKFNLSNEIVNAYKGISLNYIRQSQIDSARLYLNLALPISIQLQDFSMQADIYNNLGNVSLEESKYPEALTQFIKAANIYEKAHDADGLGKALVNIGNIENILDHYEKALDYTKRALRISEENNSYANIAYCHRLLARIYRKQKNYDQALNEYQQAITFYHKRSDRRNESETYQGIGNIYYDLKQYKEALRMHEKSLEIAHSISSPSQMAYSYSGIGFSWRELKNFNKAVAYFDSSILKAREVKNRYLVMDAYEVKSAIYAEQKNYSEALKFHQLFSGLRDSLTQDENRQATEELEARYQNEKKQDQIELLQKDRQLKNISLRQGRTVQTAMVIAFLLIIVIGVLIFNRNKMINQAKRQMEIERVRNQIARDLHDDMGSTLSSINIISQLAIKENPSSPFARYLQRIGEQSSKMMESMADMVWSINPDNDTLQKTVARMKEFSAEILEPKNVNYQFEVEESLNGATLDVAKRKNLFLVFKEAVNNAAKYSEGTSVQIHISRSGNELHLSVQDNGKGFDPAKAQNGNGLRNMKTRASEINASLSMETVPGAGTTLRMNVPLT